MDIRAFGSWMSAQKCLFFFQEIEGLTEVFAPVRRDIRVDVRGISGPKTYSLGCFFVPELRVRPSGRVPAKLLSLISSRCKSRRDVIFCNTWPECATASQLQFGGTQTGTKTNGYQNASLSKLAIVRSLRNDNKISRLSNLHFQNVICHGVSQEKQRFGTVSLSAPKAPPDPSKTQILFNFFIVVSPSLGG